MGPLQVTLVLTAAMFSIAAGLLVVPVPGTGYGYDNAYVPCGTVLGMLERAVPADNPPCEQLIIWRAWAISSAMTGLVILFGGLILSNDRVRELSRSIVCRIISPFLALAVPLTMIPIIAFLRLKRDLGPSPNPEVALLLPLGVLAVISLLLITSASRTLPSPRPVPLVLGFSLLVGSLLAIGMVAYIIDQFRSGQLGG